MIRIEVRFAGQSRGPGCRIVGKGSRSDRWGFVYEDINETGVCCVWLLISLNVDCTKSVRGKWMDRLT